MDSVFNKENPCHSVKIWSKENMDESMFSFGWTVFNSYNKDLQNGSVSKGGCIYSGQYFSALAKKTKGGRASILVMRN